MSPRQAQGSTGLFPPNVFPPYPSRADAGLAEIEGRAAAARPAADHDEAVLGTAQGQDLAAPAEPFPGLAQECGIRLSEGRDGTPAAIVRG